MSLSATETLPRPKAISAAVANDALSRTLIVRLPDTESAYSRLLWREAFMAYRSAAESGWRRGRQLWASGAAADRLPYATPGDLQTLKFHFPPGVTAYTSLIAEPDLYGIVTIDRSTSRFLSCRFLTRS